MQLNECIPWAYMLGWLMFAPVGLSVAKNKGPLPHKLRKKRFHDLW